MSILQATASGDQTARVFDVISQQPINVLAGHRSSVKQVAFNPRNPSILTTCSRDGNIHIWDLRCVGSESSLGKGITEHKPVNSILQAHADTTLKRGVTPRTDVSVTAAVWLINRDNCIATASEANSYVLACYPEPEHSLTLSNIYDLQMHQNLGHSLHPDKAQSSRCR